MRNLPRRKRSAATHLNTDTTPAPDGRRVLVVGRFLRPTCDHCDGFTAVKVVIGGRLVTIHCSECVPSPARAGVIDDIQREAEEADDYEAEDLLVLGAVA